MILKFSRKQFWFPIFFLFLSVTPTLKKLVQIHWKSSKTVYTKKVIELKTFVLVLKGEKVSNSITFMLFLFSSELFYNFFNRFKIGIKFGIFLHTYQFFFNLLRVRHFLLTLKQIAHKTAQKKYLFQMWIRINYIFPFWFRTSTVC